MQTAPHLNGLSSVEVRERFSLGLDNRQTRDTSRSLLTILRANLLTLFNAVVGGAFLVLLLLGQWRDALFGIAVIANVLIGVVQEFRSKLTLDRLAILSQSPVRVRRNGAVQEVRIEELVLDDLLELSAGDQLAADALVLESKGLELDESLLTGEAEPVARVAGQELLAGSGVSGGRGLARVIRVGEHTYASKLVTEARQFSLVASELRNSLNRLIRWISWALGPLMIVVVYGQLQATDNWLDALVRSIASIISMVPQGLVLITSIAFAIAAAKLARRKVLLQELAAVEGLARVDVVCFDKTGTLTGGTIEFARAIELYPVDNWREVIAEFAHQSDANATARALREEFPQAHLEIAQRTEFNSERKWAALEIAGVEWKLGAPEVLTKDETTLAQAATLAGEGLRTLLLNRDQQPAVLLTFREQVRPEASRALEYFKSQGVGVRVISGDHPATVSAVAKLAGLEFSGDGFDARELPTDPAALAAVMEREFVFGRVTPEQKKAMVAALQARGHVVAMIGDGVNDALALKNSDLGIAMGTGAPATKAVANLVLLDNRFESLPSVVSEGRRVIANVERLSRLFLTKTSWAMILALVFGLMLWEFPFLPRQLSAVDGFAIGIPAFLLALLPNERRYRPGFLKRSLMFCIPAGAITAIAVIVLGGIIRIQPGWTIAASQTATSILLSVTGLWVLGSLARPWTAVKVLILVTMCATAIGMFALPATTEFFGFAYLDFGHLALTVAVGSAACLLIELVQQISSRINSIAS